MFLRRLGLIALSIFWAATLCLAQLDTATILGTVYDPSGAVVPGAKVVVQNMGTAATKEVVTDQSGNFLVPLLPVGTYKVTVSMTNFTTFVQEGVKASVADRVQLFITLKPGMVTQEVTVVGKTPLVQTASTTLGAVIGTQQIEDLPLNGRGIDLLTILAPGVVNNGTVNGTNTGRLWENATKWLLDGGDTSQIDSDLAAGGYGSWARVNRASVDGVAEFRMVTGSYSAEYGHSVGAVINFISKSGTNEFHGNLFEFFRNDKLDARNAFDPAPAYKPALRLNQFGGTIGGPIVKDKLFFFTDYEGNRQRSGWYGNVFVPTAAFRASLASVLQPAVNMLPLPNGPVSPTEPRLAYWTGAISNALTEDTGMMRMDYQPTAKDRFTFRYNGNGSFTKAYFGVGDGQFRPIPAMLQTGKISYTRTLTPTMLNEFGFFVNRGHWYTPAAGNETVRHFPYVSMGSGAAVIGPGIWDMDVGNNLFTFDDTLSWIKGKHQIKIGADIQRMQCNKEVFDQTWMVFLSLDWFAANLPYVIYNEGWPRPGLRITQQGYFVQDDIQATHNLTINLGLRYQYDGAPTEAFGRIANFDVVTGKLDTPGSTVYDAPKLNFAPRIGLAWTPTKSKKTVIRAGWGMFYANYNAADAQFLPTNVPGYSHNAVVTLFDVPFGTLHGFPTPDISAYKGAFSPTAFNKDWQAAYTEQWSLGVQQALSENMVLEVGYVGNWARHYSPIQQGNPIISGTGVRRFPSVSSVTYYAAGMSTKYNSMQVSLKRRMSHGLAFDVYYTWSHNMDQGGMSFGPGAQNPGNYEAEWASADYDVRHNLIFDYTYQIPGIPKFPKWLGSGWQINGIPIIRGGSPIYVVANTDPMQIGQATSRPNLVPGQALRPANYSVPGNQLNLAAFSTPPAGTWGQAGRNLLSGPGVNWWDFSLLKRFRVHERQQLEFRYELYNMWNHPVWANPASLITAPATFGRSWSAAGGRSMQFALKYYF